MRVVLDTNVLIAAYATRGHCYDVLEHCVRSHVVISSEALLAELEEELTRKLRFSRESADELLSILRSRIEIVDPPPLDPPACRDADDDRVIATAVEGGATASSRVTRIYSSFAPIGRFPSSRPPSSGALSRHPDRFW